jgi:hypothetical protein
MHQFRGLARVERVLDPQALARDVRFHFGNMPIDLRKLLQFLSATYWLPHRTEPGL